MAQDLPFNLNVGQPIPANTPHAVSVSLPTWKANVGYEEGEKWVVSRMVTGYPRFFVHKSIQRLADLILSKFGQSDERALLLPTRTTARDCYDFITSRVSDSEAEATRIVEFVPTPQKSRPDTQYVLPQVHAVLFPAEAWPLAKSYWQHTGAGVSSRRAEFCEKALLDGYMVEKSTVAGEGNMSKGPKRYQRQVSVTSPTLGAGPNGMNGHTNGDNDAHDPSYFVEERFGRNLNIAFADQAKLATRKRIAGSLSSDLDLHEALEQPEEAEKVRADNGFSVDDVYLFPTGMNAIYQAHRTMLHARGQMKSIMFGFPYVDTLKILEKFGPGVVFYGHSSSEDLDDLERRLEGGERFLALFAEFPGNPLLRTPDLKRIRQLADKYDFAVVLDETIGNFLNVHVLPDADVIVSSLTKVFSGDSNVMGGSLILNPSSRYYAQLKRVLGDEYEDNLFAEDSIFLERNSRDFASRIARINRNAETICDVLSAHPRIKQVHYPKVSPSRHHYDAYRLPHGGYGGLLSCTFHCVDDAVAFFDALETDKGPSLGTNFTLSSPFVILAHYAELDWAAQYGCESSLVRFSVGLEDEGRLRRVFGAALDAIPSASSS